MTLHLRIPRPQSLPGSWTIAPDEDAWDETSNVCCLHILPKDYDDRASSPAAFTVTVLLEMTDEEKLPEKEFVRVVLDYLLGLIHSSVLRPEDRRPEFDPPGPSS